MVSVGLRKSTLSAGDAPCYTCPPMSDTQVSRGGGRRGPSWVLRRHTCEPFERRVLLSGALVVNTTADDTAADALLTLREAILFADGRLGRPLTAGEAAQVRVPTGGVVGALSADNITFDDAVDVIRPAAALPPVGNLDTLNGLKSAGPKVILSGENTGPDARGL